VEIAGVDAKVTAEVQKEVVDLLVDLIKVDTSNPPGDETRTARLLDAWFRARGLEGQIVGEPAERANFVLRLEGSRPGPTLLLLAHMDVVPAEPESWSVPPFDGVIQDDHVWGRGAGDIKNLVAAHAVAVSRLAASGCDFAGTVIYAATADEEEGTICGARWLVQNRPDLVRSDYLLNEGGGEYQVIRGERVYDLNTGEKGTAQFRITVHGEAGHASVPLYKGNAVVAAAQVIQAFHGYQADVHMEHLPRDYVGFLVDDAALRERLLDPGTARAALAELHECDDNAARLLEPHYGTTFSPTIVHSSSEAINVFPEQVVVTVDCRTLAGRGEDEVRVEVERALAGVEAPWELEFVGSVLGNASVDPSPMSKAIDRVMERHVPGAQMVSLHCVGFTDSNWFRAAFPDVVAYGYGPYIEESSEITSDLCHNHDERIHVRDLTFQAVFAEELVRELLR
jgi:acetylornithine deacetylase/succinyl-diaminopimelate desuccinylase-like protein